jgi:thiol-disulfide isomerase/thioredoxin
MKPSVILLFITCAALAQETKPAAPPPAAPSAAPQTAPAAPTETPAEKAAHDEVTALRRAIGEAGNSPKDYIRVLEAHLAKYPNSEHRDEIERALAKSAMEDKDNARIIKYGTAVLAKDGTDIQLLDRISRAYLTTEDQPSAAKALDYARRDESAIHALRRQPPPGRIGAVQWNEELDQATARALVLQARATGILGDKAQAIQLARRSYETYPSSEGAREWGRWLVATGDIPGAIPHYADAFTIEDPRNTEIDRAKDRRKLGELYTRANGSEKGLGDLILAAYDRTSSLMTDRIAGLKARDPNIQASSVLDFTLPGVNGKDLPLATLKNKTLVIDFWATWCGPCRAQRPLYEEVEKKFAGRDDVVFLAVDTDEDHSLVPPFVASQKWTHTVYYDGGLADFAKINSIPTTLIIDKNGQISSRLNGYIPERFVDMLTARIEDTLH